MEMTAWVPCWGGNGAVSSQQILQCSATAIKTHLVGSLFEVLLHVVEGVLGDIGDAQVGVLPHHTVLGLGLAREQLDDGGLAGAIGAHAGHAGVEAALQRHVVHHVLLHARVPAPPAASIVRRKLTSIIRARISKPICQICFLWV